MACLRPWPTRDAETYKEICEQAEILAPAVVPSGWDRDEGWSNTALQGRVDADSPRLRKIQRVIDRSITLAAME